MVSSVPHWDELRDQPVSDLSALSMGVRVDREGRMSRDYQTAMDVAKADRSHPGTVTSSRYYLADADFLVGLEGDRSLLEEINAGLAAPRWPLFLGRKAFVPSLPIRVGPPVEGDLSKVLCAHPWRKQRRWDKPRENLLRLVLETRFGEGDELRHDVPLSFADRTFTLRHVRTTFIPLPRLEDDPCFI